MKIPAVNQNNLIIAAVVVGGVWLLWRGFGGVAKDITHAAVNIGTGAAAGVAVGIGEAVGIPETSQTRCEIDCAAGNGWSASFSCDAGRYLRYLKEGK